MKVHEIQYFLWTQNNKKKEIKQVLDVCNVCNGECVWGSVLV